MSDRHRYCQKAKALNVCKNQEISGFINDLYYIIPNFQLILAYEADLTGTHKQTRTTMFFNYLITFRIFRAA